MLDIPIPEYADASSTVRLYFSHTGTSITFVLIKLHSPL